MVFSKVIIWGHKLHSHTHSYIHNAYFHAFKKLGYETFWFDDKDDVSNFNFNNCILFTEGQVDKRIPLNITSKYILHHCNKDKYHNYRHVNLCNYVNDCTLGKSHNYPGGSVEKINYFTYYDSKNRALYQPWGTTSFYDEFDDFSKLDKNISEIYYVGTVWADNINEMTQFHTSCLKNNKKLIIQKTNSELESRKFIKASFIAPDIRLRHHVNVGYIPCRIFKNISYGKVPATNSEYVANFFGKGLLPYTSNLENLVEHNIEFYNSPKAQEIFSFLSNEVKQNHTFLTRIKHILEVL